MTIVTGDSDRLIVVDAHSGRFHRDVLHSRLTQLAGEGHMIHYTATEVVMKAIELAAKDASI